MRKKIQCCCDDCVHMRRVERTVKIAAVIGLGLVVIISAILRG